MVDGKTMAIIAAATFVGGMYITAMRAGSKICANPSGFNSQMTTFSNACPNPDTVGIMRYLVF